MHLCSHDLVRSGLRALLLAMALLGAALTSGCLEDLPDPGFVDKARVLAIRAEPPQVRPGEATTLDALVVDPEGRTPTLTWYSCLIPERGRGFFSGSSQTSSSGGNGVGLDDPGSCEAAFLRGDDYASSLGVGPSVTFTPPSDLFATQDALKVAYELPEELVIPADVEPFFNSIAGVNFVVTLIAEFDDGTRLEAQKRVNVAVPDPLTDEPPNENPRDVVFHAGLKDDPDRVVPGVAPPPGEDRCILGEEDAPVVFERGETYRLAFVNVPNPQPVYLVVLAGTTSPDQPFELTETDENTFAAFFSDVAGIGRNDIESSSDSGVDWAIPDDAPATANLWVVIRDGRGGTDWCHSVITLAP